MSKEAKQFAERLANERERYRQYQRNRIQNSNIKNPGKKLTELNRIMANGDRKQTVLMEF
jgi:hypothetical protein